jgi:hypothetical protein
MCKQRAGMAAQSLFGHLNIDAQAASKLSAPLPFLTRTLCYHSREKPCPVHEGVTVSRCSGLCPNACPQRISVSARLGTRSVTARHTSCQATRPADQPATLESYITRIVLGLTHCLQVKLGPLTAECSSVPDSGAAAATILVSAGSCDYQGSMIVHSTARCTVPVRFRAKVRALGRSG